MNNNKVIYTLLAAILAVGIGVLIVGLRPGVTPNITVDLPEVNVSPELGQVGLNQLGYSMKTQKTVDVGAYSGTISSTTAYKVLSANSGRMYARISIPFDNSREVRLWFGTTTYSSGATTTLAFSTDYWAVGTRMNTSTAALIAYTIDSNNLWQGEVWAISTTSTSTMSVVER